MARIKVKNTRAKKVYGTTERPRLSIFKSIKHVYAQVIDDVQGKTLACAESEKSAKNNIETAKKVGTLIAERAAAKGIKKVVFDRRKYLYHGKVKALADSARAGGLEF